MKTKGRWAIITTLSVWTSLVVLDAQVIENPAKPCAKNSGRVVVPAEVLSISDEGASGYYFKMTRDPHIGPNGSVFVQDEKQILWFGPDGKFRQNFFKQGQGPGEMQYALGLLLTDRNVIVQAGPPDKLLWFDYEGKFERELSFSTTTRALVDVLFVAGGKYYFKSSEFPLLEGESRVVDIPDGILVWDGSSRPLMTMASFPVKTYVMIGSRGAMGSDPLCEFQVVPFAGKFLVLSHTSEYLMKIFDPEANKILREFSRPYERVKAKPQAGGVGGGSTGSDVGGPPQMKYRNDVLNIFAHGKEIWAVTSTRDEKKGILIDVYDMSGVYRDAFYLKLPKTALNSLEIPSCSTIGDGFLWLIDWIGDGNIAIRKYRLE